MTRWTLSCSYIGTFELICAIQVSKVFVDEIGRCWVIFAILTCSQFHLLFWESYPTKLICIWPGYFGIVHKFRGENGRGISLLVVATVLFHCDVAILLFSVLVYDLAIEIIHLIAVHFEVNSCNIDCWHHCIVFGVVFNCRNWFHILA